MLALLVVLTINFISLFFAQYIRIRFSLPIVATSLASILSALNAQYVLGKGNISPIVFLTLLTFAGLGVFAGDRAFNKPTN